jgi:hypothetical protein
MKRAYILFLTCALLFSSLVLVCGCGDDDGDEATSPLAGVWKGKLGEESSDEPDAIFEFMGNGDVRAFVMGMIIMGSYVYDSGDATVLVTAENFGSFGNDVVIEGTPFGEGEDTVEWTDVTIAGNTLTVTEIEDDPPDTVTYQFTKQSDPFPESAEELDATEITVNISNADMIADQYFIVFAISMEEPEEDDGPGGYGFDKLTSEGTGTVKVYLLHEYFTEDTMEFVIFGMDFYPDEGVGDDTFDQATYRGQIFVTVTKGTHITVSMDEFYPIG